MRPELWQEVLEIWPRVSARPAEEREAFLREVCGGREELRAELESLLESDSKAGAFLEQPVLGSEGEAAAPAPSEAGSRIGGRLGAFELRQLIGRGGMGTVYLGRRIDGELEQEVAVKVIRGTLKGTALEERFRAERQILAGLEHPFIARLIDAGTAPDGSPYEVMEYVEGVPITAFCDREGLDVAERVRLLAKVCQAVETAHSQSIVHRDLKPANILVTDSGDPKLLDFGIAKLLDTAASAAVPTAMPLMTPSYASPEQLGGRPVTPASDVYSLGVLLYQLTAGELPYDWQGKSPVAIEREMSEGPPRRPSEVADGPEAFRRALRGDLDNVILKALEVEPARRYADAAALRRDLERYLERRPVRARPSGWSHRLGKLIARNRVAAALIAALGLALSILAVASWRQAESRADQAEATDELRQRADEMVRFLEETFQEADPYQSSESLADMRASLETHTARVLEEMQSQPALQGRLLGTLGVIHQNLGLLDRAGELLERSLELRRGALGPRHAEVATARRDLAWLLAIRGELEEAESMLEEILAEERELRPEETADRSVTLNRLGIIAERRGDYTASEDRHREALAIRRRLQDRKMVAESLHNLSSVLSEQNRLEEAEAAAIESIEISRATSGDDSLNVGETQILLAHLLIEREELDQAEVLFEGSLAILRRRLGDRHPSVAITLNNQANLLRSLGKEAEAEAAYRECLEIHRAVFGDRHREVAVALSNLAFLLRRRGEIAAAEEHYRESVEIFRDTLGREHPTTAIVTSRLAQLLQIRGHSEEAEQLALDSLGVLETHVGSEHPRLVTTLRLLAEVRKSRGDFDAADAYLDRALAILEADHGEGSWRSARVLTQQAELLRERGELARAEALYRHARATYAEAPAHRSRERHALDLAFADLLLESGRPEAAAPLLRSSRQALSELLPPGHPTLLEAEGVRGAALAARGEREAASALLEASHAELARLLGPEAPLTLRARARMERALSAATPSGAPRG